MRLLPLASLLATAGLLVACGSDRAAAPPETSTAAEPVPAIVSPSDVAACVELEQRIAVVSHVVSGSTEAITKARNPKQLARLTGEAQQSLVISARALELADAPPALARSKRRLVAGLREYAADFERARRSTLRGDIETAAGQLHDEIALDKIVTSLKKIDRACRA